MKIERTGLEFQRTELAKGVQNQKDPAAAKDTQVGTQTGSGAPRSDSVQISDAGRALAAQQGTTIEPTRGPLDADRIDQIRQRVLSGAYNSVEVVGQVARRMLESGDI